MTLGGASSDQSGGSIVANNRHAEVAGRERLEGHPPAHPQASSIRRRRRCSGWRAPRHVGFRFPSPAPSASSATIPTSAGATTGSAPSRLPRLPRHLQGNHAAALAEWPQLGGTEKGKGPDLS